MTPPAVESDLQHAVPHHPLAAPSVWLSDPFCYTPWYSAALATALRRAGAQVRFLSPSVEREPEYFPTHGIETDPGPLRFGDRVRAFPRIIRRGLRFTAAMGNVVALMGQLERSAKFRPDVIHLQQLPALNHGISIDLTLIEKARRCRIPVVHTVHNLLPHDTGDRLRTVYQRLYLGVNHLLCHSSDVADLLIRDFNVTPGKVSVVPHGPLFEAPPATDETVLRARIRLNIRPHRAVVLWQGVIAPYKGLDTLLKAWSLCMLRWKDPHTRPLLLIAGSGSAAQKATVAEMVKPLSATVRADLRYISSTELPDYYHVADLLVYPYHAITTSGALLTGLSYRKPIVASDLPAFRQYLRHNENALLVSPGDMAELAEALYMALRGISGLSECRRTYAALMAGARKNRCRYMDWDTIAQRTLSLYRNLILHK